MKLVRFTITPQGHARLGVITPLGIMEVETFCKLFCMSHSFEFPALPQSPLEFLQCDEGIRKLIDKAAQWALGNDSGHPTMLSSPESVTLLAPIPSPGKIICIGHNYKDHCAEQNAPIPEEPVIFTKFNSAIQHPGAPIVCPPITSEMDFEAELAVVIGRKARDVSVEEALSYAGGYMNFNDITARDVQRHDSQWIRAKSSDTFAPMGPCLITAEAIDNPQSRRIQMRLNGKVMQDSNTSQMIFPVAKLISYISKFATLYPGDIIATGTPPGVGGHRQPPVFLKDGDEMEVEVEGLGILKNTVRSR